MRGSLLFLTGASGAGKTALVDALAAEAPRTARAVFLHFDAVGVPARDAMMRDYGSGERWQAEATRAWTAKIVREHADAPLVVLEGQVRPSVIERAFVEHGVARGAIVLVRCDDEEREARLRRRGQPDLANAEMRAWSAFLAREAEARGLAVVDTTHATPAEAVAALRRASPLL